MADRTGLPRSRRARSAATVAVAAVLLAGCGSSSDGPSAADLSRQRLETENTAYLVGIGFERSQARCVAHHVDMDVSTLLDGKHDQDPTTETGFDQFAAAVRSCIRKDTTTTTR